MYMYWKWTCKVYNKEINTCNAKKCNNIKYYKHANTKVYLNWCNGYINN